jgi:outer membrane protein assembly factor BamB
MHTLHLSLSPALAFVLACAPMLHLRAAGWEQFHGTDGNRGRALAGPDLSVHTTPRFQVGSGLGSSTFGFGSTSGPVVDEGKIFCYNAGGAVLAFRESDGAPLWETAVAAASSGSWSSPSACAGRVYIGSGEYVFCLDAETGALLWSHPLTAPGGSGETSAPVVNAAPAVAEDLGLCYMHTYGGFGGGTRLHAIHAADGTPAWTLDLTGQGQGAVAYNPALRLVYTTVGTEGGWAEGRGGIAAIDARTGALRWTSAGSFEPLNFGGVAFDAAHNRVVAAGYDFYGYSGLLVCDGATGATVAFSGDDAAPSGDYTPAIGGDGRIYVCGAEWQDGPFAFCFDGATATQVWRTAASEWGTWNASVAYAEDNGAGQRVVYCPGGAYGSQSESYGMLDADTGAVLATVGINGGNAALDHGNLYYISADGALVAFGPPVHVIDVACGPYGAMFPDRDQSVEAGGSVTFRFGPEVADVSVDGVSVGAVEAYTFADVSADHTLAATFRDPFASALVPGLTHAPYHSSALWNSPDAVLGKPCVIDKDDRGASVREISLAWAAWYKGSTNATLAGLPYSSVPAAQLRNNGCGLKRTVSGGVTNIGQIVVEFAQAVSNDVRNPYGIDLLVHGNAFFAGSGYNYSNSNMEVHLLSSFGGVFGEPVTVSVAQYEEGPWYTYTNTFGDTSWPTQPFRWDWAAHGWSPREMEWTKPVDPALAGTAQAGISAARAISLYDGSAGGTGFDLAESGFEWVRYVKLTDPDNIQGEICGLVDVAAYLGTYRVFAAPSEGGSVSGAGAHESGATLTVVARPAAGYTFDRWVSLPPGARADGHAATFTVNRNVTVEAAFRPSRRTMFILK